MTRNEFKLISDEHNMWNEQRKKCCQLADEELARGNAFEMYYQCKQAEKIMEEYMVPLFNKMQLVTELSD